MSRIASIGEALVDFAPVESDGRLAGFTLHLGGSPYNVAIGLARLGQEAFFAGRISRDLFGELLVAHLAANGVSQELLLRGPEPAALAFVSAERTDSSYTFRWDGTADRELRATDLAHAGFASLHALHFGSVALTVEPCGTAIEELVSSLAGRVFLTLDPNVRAFMVGDWDGYRSRVERCAVRAELVKVSRADLEALGVADASRWVGARSGPAAVVVTNGRHGSLVLRRGRPAVASPAVPARVVDAVGAGDAYTAGLLSALAERDALTRAGLLELYEAAWLSLTAFASAAAAISCERAGADPPAAAEVRRRLSEDASGGVDRVARAANETATTRSARGGT